MTQLIETLPARDYLTDEQHVVDLRQVLQNSWQVIGHVSQFSDQIRVVEMSLLNHSVLISRDDSNEVRVFHNVCRHRAGPLRQCPGRNNRIRCRYHGWSYGLDGQLMTAPEMDTTEGFTLTDYRLQPVRHALWNGFIFASLSDHIAPLEDYLGGLSDVIAPIDLTAFSYHHRDDYVIDCNWKVYMDNYLEGYHIPHIHPELNRMIDYRSYHTEIRPWYSYQYSPLEQDEGLYGSGQVHYVTLFPNTMLNVYPSRLQTNSVIPLAHDQCRVIFDYYYQDPDHPKTREMIDQDIAFSDLVQQEDIDICLRVQRGLESGAYEKGPLSARREQGVIHYQRLYRQALGREEAS